MSVFRDVSSGSLADGIRLRVEELERRATPPTSNEPTFNDPERAAFWRLGGTGVRGPLLHTGGNHDSSGDVVAIVESANSVHLLGYTSRHDAKGHHLFVNGSGHTIENVDIEATSLEQRILRTRNVTDGLTFRNWRIVVPDGKIGKWGGALWLHQGEGIEIEDVHIENAGVWFGPNVNPTDVETQITRRDKGRVMLFQPLANVTVRRMTIAGRYHHGAKPGIRLRGCVDVRFEDCDFAGGVTCDSDLNRDVWVNGERVA